MQIFSGIVVHGDKIGRTLGYPTANIDIAKEGLGISAGVYAAWTSIGEEKFKGALVVLDSPWKVEVHIIDMTPRDLYGQTITLEIVKKVSEVVQIDSLNELKNKIIRDIALVNKCLSFTP